jgi:ATP-dependent DNA helicase DinG
VLKHGEAAYTAACAIVPAADRLARGLRAARKRRLPLERLTLGDSLDRLVEAARSAASHAKAALATWETRETDPAPASVYGQLGRYARALGRLAQEADAFRGPEDPGHVRYAEPDALVRHPIEVGAPLARLLWQVYPRAVLTSATLATDDGLGYYRREVGLAHLPARAHVYPSPFDLARQACYYVPTPAAALVPPPARADAVIVSTYRERLAYEIVRLVEASRGGALVLFTARDTLLAVAPAVQAAALGRWPVLIQDGDTARGQLLRAFREHGSAVLLGLRSFFEGIDVPGPALRLVVLDRLPFPPPDDPVYAARARALAARGESAFDALMVPAAILTLRQIVGRLVRRHDDYGVVALLDGRLLTKERYGHRIRRSLPTMRCLRDTDAVARFLAHRARAVGVA